MNIKENVRKLERFISIIPHFRDGMRIKITSNGKISEVIPEEIIRRNK